MRLCLRVLAAVGQRPDNAQDTWHAQLNCDAMWVPRDSLAGRSLTTAAVLAGLAALGRTYAPVATFAKRFGAEFHDGAALTRTFVFSKACTCYHYQGGYSSVVSG